MKEIEQPTIYKNENELIKWLQLDLRRQRDEGVKEDELILNIGSSDSLFVRSVEVGFDFDFDSITISCFPIDSHRSSCLGSESSKTVCRYKLNCSHVVFKNTVNFKHVIFQNVVDFHRAIFQRQTTFFLITFNGGANFEYATFNNKINFVSIKIESTLQFENIKLESNSYISFNGINYDYKTKKLIENKNSKIEFINTVINGRVDFHNVYLSELNLEGSNIIGIFNRIKLEAYPSNFDTACILKNEELKKNNTIKALEFKAIEKDLYTSELESKKDKTIQNWAEILSLKLSKLSNNHGQDWFRAVLFTLISGLMFFTLSQVFFYIGIIQGVFLLYLSFILNIYIYYFYSLILDVVKKEEKYYILIHLAFTFISLIAVLLLTKTNTNLNFYCLIKNGFNYFIPTNFDLIKNIDTNISNLIGFSIFYILGKLAIGYGIFEVIQAFRKLNSKG